MKVTKKIIIILIVLVGMLILGMSEVNAQNLPKSSGKVIISDLKKNAAKNNNRYFIGYSQDYLTCSNLHCAQHGQRLWSSRYIL